MSRPISSPNCMERSFSEIGVLDGVMEQCGGKRRLIEPVAGQHVGHGQRMGDIGIAGFSHLAGMRLSRYFVCPSQQVDVPIGVMGEESTDDIVECRLSRLSRT